MVKTLRVLILSLLLLGGVILLPMLLPESSPAPSPALHPLVQALQDSLARHDRLDAQLYVMAHCPYGTAAEKALLPYVQNHSDQIDLKIHYIAGRKGPSEFSSLHGPEEVEEGIRQVIMARLYPEQYWDYLLLIADQYETANWEELARQAGMDPEKIREVYDSGEGHRWFQKNSYQARKKRVATSPTLHIQAAEN